MLWLWWQVSICDFGKPSNIFQPLPALPVPRRRGNRQWQQLEFVAGNREMGHDILHFGQGDASEFARFFYEVIRDLSKHRFSMNWTFEGNQGTINYSFYAKSMEVSYRLSLQPSLGSSCRVCRFVAKHPTLISIMERKWNPQWLLLIWGFLVIGEIPK